MSRDEDDGRPTGRSVHAGDVERESPDPARRPPGPRPGPQPGPPIGPPRLAAWLLRRMLPRGGRTASILGDLFEELAADTATRSRSTAVWRYWHHTLSIAARAVWRDRRPARAARRAREARQLDRASTRRLPPAVRSRRRSSMLFGLRDEIRYACRLLVRQPAFAAVAVLTLAVGVGANTAIFSVLQGVVLRDLPYRDADRLVLFWTQNLRQQVPDGSSYLNARDWKAQSRALEDLAVYRRPEPTPATITDGQEPERVDRTLVGPGFFSVLGTPALLGRTLGPADFESGSRAVVISHGLWRQRFGGDARAIGRAIEINGTKGEVVGVMAPDFAFPSANVQVWQPISVMQNWPRMLRDPRSRGADALMVLGRLTPVASIESARAELDTIAARLRDAYPATNGGRGITIEPLTDHVIGSRTGRSLWLLFGAVGFVLLIACANVANLVLLRGASRRAELALRTALGASLPRLMRQALAETLVVSALAAGAGLLIAWAGTAALRTWASGALPRLDAVRLDAGAFLFALTAALACGLVAGLLPAWHLSTVNPVETLRDASPRALGGRGSRQLRHALVIAEIALAVVLLSGAGLLMRSFVRLQAVDRGFDSRHVLLLQVDLPRKYDGQASKARYFGDAFARIRALPGVVAAGAISDLFIERHPDLRVVLEGQPTPDPAAPAPPLIRDRVIPGYFEAIGTPLLRGRFLQDTDLVEDLDRDQPNAVVINDAMARRFWPGENPVGKRWKPGTNPHSDEPWVTVVGVVADMKRQRLDDAAIPCVFWPGFGPQMDVVVRTTGDPATMRDAIRAELRAIDPTTPPFGVVAVERRLNETVALRTLQTLLLGALAAAALILAVIGVYGLAHQSVVARTQEIGVRMALGASAGSVLRMVLAGALGLAAAGFAIGLLGAIALARTIGSFLYETSPVDPLIYAGVAALLALVTTAACLAPARRAALVDPLAALRGQ